MTRDTLAEAAVEFRRERAEELLRAYVDALIAAQTSHEAFDWVRAGSAFKRYADAAVMDDPKPVGIVPTREDP